MSTINNGEPTVNEVLKEVVEVEHHLHGWEKWLGAAASPSGETHVADRATLTPFQIDAGNDTFGAWVQILGSSDTPVETGMVKFDLHRVQLLDVETTLKETIIQIGFGATGAAALTANTYTEVMLRPESKANRGDAPITVMMKRVSAGTKCWARCWVNGTNTSTVDFVVGIHEYDA
jgi:hypothetical protein